MAERFHLPQAYLTRDLCSNQEGIVPNLALLISSSPCQQWEHAETHDRTVFFGDFDKASEVREEGMHGYGLRFTEVSETKDLLVRHGIFEKGILMRG